MTAFFIAKAKQCHGIDIDIHIYDKNEFVGGGELLVAPSRTLEILIVVGRQQRCLSV